MVFVVCFTIGLKVTSVILPITCGVPQGAFWDPFFLVYVNDVVNVSDLLRFVMYADDINILFSHPGKLILINTILNIDFQNMIHVIGLERTNYNLKQVKLNI